MLVFVAPSVNSNPSMLGVHQVVGRGLKIPIVADRLEGLPSAFCDAIYSGPPRPGPVKVVGRVPAGVSEARKITSAFQVFGTDMRGDPLLRRSWGEGR